MEPIDERITAARLMSLREGPNASAVIAALLGVREMPPVLALRTLKDIETFVATGDATAGAQLIHAASIRVRRGTMPRAGARPGEAEMSHARTG